jgi:YkoY family integral membrane protein
LGADLLTIAMLVGLEGLLSADNALVIAVLVLGLPKPEQKNAMRYGMAGAFAFRAMATALAAYLMRVAWVRVAGGAYLLYLAAAHFRGGEEGRDRHAPAVPRPILGLSPFWSTVLRVELVDVAFSIDSVLVAVAMSPKLWVVITGGILGIVTMRLVAGRLLALIERYPVLVDGAFVIIAWVGAKLILEYAHITGWVHFEVPKSISLGAIVVIFGAFLAYAMWKGDAREGVAIEAPGGRDRH